MSLRDLDFAAIRARLKRDEAAEENFDFQSAALYELSHVIALSTAGSIRESMAARGAAEIPELEPEPDPRRLPGLILISPDSGEVGTTVAVTITGTDLDIARFHIDGQGVEWTVTAVTPTQMELAVVIDLTAAPTDRILTLTSLAGSTIGAFEILPR